MSKESPFYSAVKESQLKINELLALPASGDEYSWEFELADASKLDMMCRHLEAQQLELEDRSALALITIASLEEAVDQGLDVKPVIARLQTVFHNDESLQLRMASFWIDQGNAEHTEMAIDVIM